MKKVRVLPTLLALIFALNTSMPFAAVDVRDASPVLESYGIGIYAEGNSSMDITFEVWGTKTMDRLGASSLFIEEEILPDTWVLFDMLYFDFDDERYFTEDSVYHIGHYYFNGLPGNRYRATLTAYAELDGVSDTGEVSSPARVCY